MAALDEAYGAILRCGIDSDRVLRLLSQELLTGNPGWEELVYALGTLGERADSTAQTFLIRIADLERMELQASLASWEKDMRKDGTDPPPHPQIQYELAIMRMQLFRITNEPYQLAQAEEALSKLDEYANSPSIDYTGAWSLRQNYERIDQKWKEIRQTAL